MIRWRRADPRVAALVVASFAVTLLILEAVGNQYDGGRVTAFSDREILEIIKRFLSGHGEMVQTPQDTVLAVEKIECAETK